jgi:hypothetical protein
MSDPKEPNYFARHLSLGRVRGDSFHTNFDRYLALFEEAGSEHLAVGEASTRYLRSPQALRDIRKFAPGARIIVQLRNPLEMARSWHAQKLWEGQETEPDFERAWRLQPEREEGHNLPRSLRASDALLYEKVASLGTQLERLLDIFPRNQVLILFHDDLAADPRRVYEQTLDFLGAPSDGRRDFSVVNASREHRFPRLARRLRERPVWIDRAVTALGLRGRGLGAAFEKASAKARPADAFAPAFKQELIDTFAPEVARLVRITGRDLGSWIKD